MPKLAKPVRGHSYRFDLGTEKSAVDLMFDVEIPGRRNLKAAVKKARETLEWSISESGTDFKGLNNGRLYLHPENVTEDRIILVTPIKHARLRPLY